MPDLYNYSTSTGSVFLPNFSQSEKSSSGVLILNLYILLFVITSSVHSRAMLLLVHCLDKRHLRRYMVEPGWQFHVTVLEKPIKLTILK